MKSRQIQRSAFALILGGLSCLAPLTAIADTNESIPALNDCQPRHHGSMAMHELNKLQLSPQQLKEIHDLDNSFHSTEQAEEERINDYRQRHLKALLAILTPTQQAKFKRDMESARLDSHEHHRHHHHNPTRDALRSLDLTSAQLEQVHAADEAFKKSWHPGQPPNPEAFEAHRKAILAILTPDQQVKFQKALTDHGFNDHQLRGDKQSDRNNNESGDNDRPAPQDNPSSEAP